MEFPNVTNPVLKGFENWEYFTAIKYREREKNTMFAQLNDKMRTKSVLPSAYNYKCGGIIRAPLFLRCRLSDFRYCSSLHGAFSTLVLIYSTKFSQLGLLDGHFCVLVIPLYL